MLHEWLELLASERWNLLGATAAHLELVVEAVLLAVLVGVPLGILAARSRNIERAAIGVTNVLQTIPSLALLGFLLIAFRGQIGKAPALAALVLYSLLPIVKNTILGLRSIDPGVQEASVALGMTASQRLFLVELPLAVPIVLGGVRVATVAAVGMATIAAAIGARGLGSYIFRGVALSDTRLILMGSVPAALLALVCDAGLGEIERRLDPTRRRRSRRTDHRPRALPGRDCGGHRLAMVARAPAPRCRPPHDHDRLQGRQRDDSPGASPRRPG